MRRLDWLAGHLDLWKLGRMIANGAQSLYQLLLFMTILGLGNCRVAHALEHSSNQRKRVVSCILTMPFNKLLMYMAVIAPPLKLAGHMNR